MVHQYTFPIPILFPSNLTGPNSDRSIKGLLDIKGSFAWIHENIDFWKNVEPVEHIWKLILSFLYLFALV